MHWESVCRERTLQGPARFVQAILVSLAAWSILVSGVSFAQTASLKNGSFDQWSDGKPVGWVVETGASNGGKRVVSEVSKGDGPCLVLSGNAQTSAWQLVSQTVPLEGGKCYRLNYAAKAEGIRREGRQFDNCYVAVFQKHERGQVLVRNVYPQTADEFQESSAVFRAHRSASSAQVMIFLSKTGTLSVKDVALTPLEAEDSFQVLVDEMDRYYSYFQHKKVDWPGLVNKYRSKVEGTDNDQFVKAVSEMLAEIEDSHIWIEHRRRRLSSYAPGYTANYRFAAVDKDLSDVQRFGEFGLTGMTSDGFGYIRIVSLAVKPESVQAMAKDIRDRLFETPGIILDIRNNRGGSEMVGQQIASLFADKHRLYGRAKFRSGPKHNQFVEGPPRYVIPAERVYTRPVVCLVGPGCVSSGEGFAMMMKSIPHVSLVGQPTRGASGNPQPVQLPNGVDVWFSRWMSLLPDGTPIEGDGVPPDETVEHAEGDRTYVRAGELLKKSSK